MNLNWFQYFIKFLIGRRRFLGFTMPKNKEQLLYDRHGRKWLKIFTRDIDDWIQIEHIFLNEEFDFEGTGRKKMITDLHKRMVDKRHIPLIIDLGSNIGLASKYFNEIYPDSHIVAVEPDPGNCELARKNLPKNSILYQAAISSRNGTGSIVSTGRNCGFRIEANGGVDVKLLTVNELLSDANHCLPFLIKIDIEGFESDLFSANTDWIERFPILLIELHDWMAPGQLLTKNFLKEISKYDREFMHFDGYVVSLARNLDKC